jgi:7-keto-8-aminopelargonate synthetase-like enzyme
MREKYFDLVYSVIKDSTDMGVAHLITDNKGFNNNEVGIKGSNFLSFSLCDYLGLSRDTRLKEGAIQAILNHGVYTAVSKTYIKLDIYQEAEELLSKVFKFPCLIFPRTTLAHIGVLPILTESNDAIVLDHQVHTSVHLAADTLKGYGNYCETIRHNRIDILEDRIKVLSKKYNRIWYLTDGVYSMHGDLLPVDELISLLNKNDQLRLYIDDAHGMSWVGKNGKGFVLSKTDYHPHMIITTSLGKGFGAGGGVTVCYDEEIKNKLSACSPPLMFSSPVSPATLGAIIESSKIHLSEEINILQSDLIEKINFFLNRAKELNLPIIDQSISPIFYIATGKPDMCCEIGNKLMNRNIYINGGVYPSVPFNNSGIRAVLSVNHSKTDINNLLEALKEEHDIALKKRNLSIGDILKYYKLNYEQ